MKEIANWCMKFDPLNAETVYIAGLCSYYDGNLSESLNYFEKVRQLNPDDIKARIMRLRAITIQEKKEIADAFNRAKEFNEAWNIYKEALAIDPLNANMNATLYFNRALMESMKTEDHASAVSDCTEALRLRPNYLNARLLRAKCHIHMKKLEECIDDCKAALKIEESYAIQQALNGVKKILKWFEYKKTKCSHTPK